MSEQTNDKSFLNHQLVEVLDDLSDMVKTPDTDMNLFFQPIKQAIDLLSHGANINTQNKWGETILHLACYSDNPFYAVEEKSLSVRIKDFFKNGIDYSKLGYCHLSLAVKKALPFVKDKNAKEEAIESCIGQIHALKFRIKKRVPRAVFLSVEKILTSYSPNPFVKDARFCTPGMALAKKLRTPLLVEKRPCLTQEQAEYKMAEFDILSSYENAYQASRTATALRAIMALSALRDNEKAIKDLSPIVATAVRASRPGVNGPHDENDKAFTTHVKAERLIHTIIKASNNLSGYTQNGAKEFERGE